MFFSNKKILGLDVGSHSIKIAEIDYTRGKPTLINFGYKITPGGSVGTGEINNPEEVSEIIRELVLQLKTSRKRVAAGLFGSGIIVKKITIPQMEKSLIGEQVKWEAEQYIPFDMNEISLDYFILKNSSVDEGSMDILLVASKQEVILQYAETIESSGLQNCFVDVSSFALANCFEVAYGIQSNKNIVLVHVGAEITHFIVISNGELIFCRDILVGGANFTGEISKELGINFAEAEALKISSSQKNVIPQEISTIVSKTMEYVIEEIKNSIDFFKATFAGGNIDACFISGGSMKLTGFFEHIFPSMSFPVHPFNPFGNIQYNKKLFNSNYIDQISYFSPVAIGLALRQMGDK